ncbi:MAG: beta-ketoacyl-ACP synthase II [Micromonosporaceae bacterium]|nr:beta-ketoacyl-ACP synthase II [Micromonosporaceae bacterium]
MAAAAGPDCACRRDPGDGRRRVVVTGLGATTPLGGDVTSTWQAMLRGDNGIRRLSEPWVDQVPIPLGAPVLREPGPGLSPVQRRRIDRCGQLAVTAAQEAWSDAGFDGTAVAPDRTGVAISTAMGGISTLIGGYETWKARGWRRIHPAAIPMAMANAPAAVVGLLLGARAGIHAMVSACASGAHAIATAADMIRAGHADVVVTGGADAPLHPLVLSGFATMRALSQRVSEPAAASRPYDAGRDGFVLGEGAGVLVLEAEEHASRRGARVYAELAGVGITSDAYHLAHPEPTGVVNATAIRTSLAAAGVTAAEVEHVNANATSTVPGDAAEARALASVFGEAAGGPAVSANKSMTGHTLGAAGAIESIATVLAIRDGVAPATANFARPDRDVAIDVVHGAPRPLGGSEIVALKNSTGFGGHNVAITFRGRPMAARARDDGAGGGGVDPAAGR